MGDLPSDIEALVRAEKWLLQSPVWDRSADRRYFGFAVPLTVDEVTVGTFQLRGKAAKAFPDRDALMQLEFRSSARARAVALWRVQWRPLEVHTNKQWGPPGYELAQIAGSHEHRFEDNWYASENRMRGGNLPAAVPLAKDPGTFSDFVDFCGECFRIQDMGLVSVPPSTADLFWVPDD